MKIKKGTKLIAINECKMHISGAEALVIGKEYKVYHSTDKVFFIESEIDSAHEFSFDTATKYFKAKGETTAEQHQTASEQQSSVTAVEWFYDKIKSHFEHDGDLLETLTFTMVIAKVKERTAWKYLGCCNKSP